MLVDHGKTTFSDNLLGAAGIISEKKAGQELTLDTSNVEQERQMTVYASDVRSIDLFLGLLSF